MLHQSGDVVGHALVGQRAVEVGSVAVALQFDGDDLPLLGQRGQVGAEHGDTNDSAVQKDRRFAGAANLVVEVKAVYGSIAGFDGRFRGRAILSDRKERCCQDDSGGGGSCEERPSQVHG